MAEPVFACPTVIGNDVRFIVCFEYRPPTDQAVCPQNDPRICRPMWPYKRLAPYFTAFLCNASYSKQCGYPISSANARSCGYFHNADLYPHYLRTPEACLRAVSSACEADVKRLFTMVSGLRGGMPHLPANFLFRRLALLTIFR